jgi:hypothetical protein
MTVMKKLLEGDVVKLTPKQKSNPEAEFHLAKMREHAQMQKAHDNLMMDSVRKHDSEIDPELKQHFAKLRYLHEHGAQIHSAIKNHHYQKFNQATASAEAEYNRRHIDQHTDHLPDNAVRLRTPK